MRRDRLWLAVGMFSLALGCGREAPSGEPSGQPRGDINARIKAAGGADNNAILGMETPNAWSTTTSGAVLGQSSIHSRGSYSLSVRQSNSNGYTPIKSIPMTTLAVVSPTLAVDVMLPYYQPNPWWYGTAQAYIDCPSRGIYSQFLNQVELTGKPRGVWNTINFTLTNSHIAGLLQSGYSDLTITVVVNVQVPTTGIYLIDNLRFVPVAANGCGGRPNGTSCTDNSACTLGDTCQSGVCHSGTALTCPPSDSCQETSTCNPHTGLCTSIPRVAGTLCRPAIGDCDESETCDGTSLGCPPDGFLQASLECRPAAGPCDVAEACSGTGAECPPDLLVAMGTVCRLAIGPCDVSEFCDGTYAACPSDGFVQGLVECRPSAGDCDIAETCSGTGPDCQPDAFAAAGTVCRTSTGDCDPAETCSGSSPTCPTDTNAEVPAVPSGLAAMAGNGHVSLTWTASSAATSYNLKRGTTTGGPYDTVFSSAGPSYTDTDVTNGTYYYYLVTAVNDCGESASSSEVSGTPFVPIPPRRLPKAPSEVGCYWYTSNGWEPILCEPVENAIQSVGPPVVPPSLATPYVEGTPNPPTSPKPVFIPAPDSPYTPLVFGQVDIMFPVVGTETDEYLDPPPFDVCPSLNLYPAANRWSVQLNTNKFLMDNGNNAAVQFAVQSTALGNATYICAWQVDSTDQDYDATSVCVKAPPPTRSSGLQPFDFISIAGSVDAAAGTLSIVVQLSWVEPGWPNIYSRTGPDNNGLAGRWLTLDGAVLGIGKCSEAHFTDTSVVTRLMASSCPGVTGATSSTSGCPTPTLQPNVSFENKTATAESNNLIQIGTPLVSYLNPYLAVTNTIATTSGACLDPKHIYVRDYDSDSGAVPSNAAGQAFWESPDIFLVPKDSPVSPNSTPDQSVITPDGEFDIWVRVHNDLGCAEVKGAKALVYIADPSALSTSWSPLTDNKYLAATPEGTTVSAGGRALIGPFRYHAPTSGFGDGHKCLIAAIIADGEPPVDDYFDAPSSNQVAQRNVEFENCAFPLTDATGFDGDVEIALSVVPPETSPSLGTAGPNISVEFDDGDSGWHDLWMAQPENGTAYAVSRLGGKTTVRLGKAGVTLYPVPLYDGESRTARVSISGLPSGAPLTTLGLQATLRNPSTGELLAPPNGGSCRMLGGIIIP